MYLAAVQSPLTLIVEDDTKVTLERNPKTDRLRRAAQKTNTHGGAGGPYCACGHDRLPERGL